MYEPEKYDVFYFKEQEGYYMVTGFHEQEHRYNPGELIKIVDLVRTKDIPPGYVTSCWVRWLAEAIVKREVLIVECKKGKAMAAKMLLLGRV